MAAGQALRSREAVPRLPHSQRSLADAGAGGDLADRELSGAVVAHRRQTYPRRRRRGVKPAPAAEALPYGLFETPGCGEQLLDVARSEVFIDAPAEQVFELLGDPRTFSRWVVGARAVRAADATWPQPGTAFDHAVGIGPLQLRDHTSV